MMQSDTLEFWVDGHVYDYIKSNLQPLIGELISIRGDLYRVISRNFALDYVNNNYERSMRLAINLEKVERGEAT